MAKQFLQQISHDQSLQNTTALFAIPQSSLLPADVKACTCADAQTCTPIQRHTLTAR